MKIKISLFIVLFLMILGSNLNAQNQNSSKDLTWKKVCNKEGTACNGKIEMFLSQEKDGVKKIVGRIASLDIIKRTGGIADLILYLPLGVDVRKGIVFKIDNGQQMNAPYTRCLQEGCESVLRLSQNSIKTLKQGSIFHLGFLPFAGKKINVIKIPLKGFTATFNSLKIR